MHYPTDAKLLWEGIEKAYGIMCGLSEKMNQHRPRTKYLDVETVNLAYRKQRRHTNVQTRKITRRLLNLWEKVLTEIRKMERKNIEMKDLLKVKKANDIIRKELARVRATKMEGSFGTRKNAMA